MENRGAADPGNFQVQVLLSSDLAMGSPPTLTRADLVPDATGQRFSSPAGFAVKIPPGQTTGPLSVGIKIIPDLPVPDAAFVGQPRQQLRDADRPRSRSCGCDESFEC